MKPSDDSRSSNISVPHELDEIESRYARRKQRGTAAWKQKYYARMRNERNRVFQQVLADRFSDVEQLRCLEIGAGRGENLGFFRDLGIPWNQIAANELLNDRVDELKHRFPEIELHPGNALDIQTEPFDVILISAVFSSILDEVFRARLADHTLNLLTPTGCILWHDFSYQNPLNRDVSGITIRQLKAMYGHADVAARKITLTPPVALLVGPLYPLFARISFLRSHVLAVISSRKA